MKFSACWRIISGQYLAHCWLKFIVFSEQSQGLEICFQIIEQFKVLVETKCTNCLETSEENHFTTNQSCTDESPLKGRISPVEPSKHFFGALFQLDHINSLPTYSTNLSALALRHEVACHLVLKKNPQIFLLALLQVNIQGVIRGIRTQPMDRSRDGQPCRERKLTEINAGQLLTGCLWGEAMTRVGLYVHPKEEVPVEIEKAIRTLLL